MHSVCVGRVAQPFARGGSAESVCAVRARMHSVCVAREHSPLRGAACEGAACAYA